MKKKIFIAQILRELTVNGVKYYGEITFVIVKAENDKEAENVAQKYGESIARTYNNSDGELVKWEFIRLVSVNIALCEEIEDATPIFTQTYKDMVSYDKSVTLRQLE